MAVSWRVHVRSPRKPGGKWRMVARATADHPIRSRELQATCQEARDRTQAQLEVAAWERLLNESGQEVLGQALTVLDVLDARLKSLVRLKANQNSIRRTRNARKRLEQVALVPVSRWTRAALLQARESLQERGLAPATINTDLATLAAAWRWAEERDAVSAPWPRVRPLRKGPRKKRPYTDEEVRRILEWAGSYRAGAWLPIFATLADTGRRVSAVLGLRGRDVNYETGDCLWHEKGDQVLAIPVSSATLPLLPRVEPNEPVFGQFGRRRSAGLATRRESVRKVLKRALKELKIPDPERLDTHSLRRAWCATAERNGVPVDVGRRVTGHRTRAMWDHYQAEAVGDDLRQAVETVAAARRVPQEVPSHPEAAQANSSLRWDLNPQPHHYEPPPNLPQPASTAGATKGEPGSPSVPKAGKPCVGSPAGELVRELLNARDPVLARWARVAAHDEAAVLEMLREALAGTERARAMHAGLAARAGLQEPDALGDVSGAGGSRCGS